MNPHAFITTPIFTSSSSSAFLQCHRRHRQQHAKHAKPARTRTIEIIEIKSSAASSTSTTADPLARSSLLHLQNGSDIRGVASPLLPTMPVTLTASAIHYIITSFVRKVSTQLQKPLCELRFCLGRDSRISGPELLQAAALAAASVGVSVTSFDICTTPAMFMATVLPDHDYDCACMLTASHLPPNRNGIKFFTKAGSANKSDIQLILSNAADAIDANNFSEFQIAPDAHSRITQFDFLSVYSEHLVGVIRKGCGGGDDMPLKGFTIVVDAGNGSGGFFADKVLKQLGANVIGQFLDPDGTFPNHVPNPEDKKAMAMTVDKVLETQANLGIIFDTDVDRAGFVDSTGMCINRNQLIALLSHIVIRKSPGSTIVTDSVTSNGLARYIEKLGGKHFRYRKGYKNVIDKGIELNSNGINTELAIETSGHGAMKENYMLDDGAYLAVKIIIEMFHLKGGDIGNLLNDLQVPEEEMEFRLGFVDSSDFYGYGSGVVDAFRKFADSVQGWKLEEENYEGFRVRVDQGDGKEGWLLLRQSLHDPLLPLNVESDIAGGITSILSILTKQFFPNFANIDTSQLETYMNNNQ